jgi:hypothetical protein
MPYKEEPISLQGFLVWIPLKFMVRKTLIGKRYIHLATYLFLLQVEYENGAVLGRAMLNKLDILKKMLLIPGLNFTNVIKDAQEAAEKHLDEFKKEHGDEPETFNDFIYWPSWETATGLSYGELFKPEHIKNRERTRKRLSRIFQKKLGKKVPLEEAQPLISTLVLEGIGFGSTFPKLTEKMHKNAYEKTDDDFQRISRALGFSTPEDQALTLKEREDGVLQKVAAYTSEYYPELLDPLDLRGHLAAWGDLLK